MRSENSHIERGEIIHKASSVLLVRSPSFSPFHDSRKFMLIYIVIRDRKTMKLRQE